MRTATPIATCSVIADCGPSATSESISTPRFIGPGCMTSAPGLARFQPFRGQAVAHPVFARGGDIAARHPLVLDTQHHDDVGILNRFVEIGEGGHEHPLDPLGHQRRGRADPHLGRQAR